MEDTVVELIIVLHQSLNIFLNVSLHIVRVINPTTIRVFLRTMSVFALVFVSHVVDLISLSLLSVVPILESLCLLVAMLISEGSCVILHLSFASFILTSILESIIFKLHLSVINTSRQRSLVIKIH